MRIKSYLKKNRIALIVCGVMSIIAFSLLLASMVVAKHTPEPIQIHDEQGLNDINKNLNGYYIIKNDITITDKLQQIGDEEHPFTGTIVGTYYRLLNFKLGVNTTIETGNVNKMSWIPNNKGILYGITLNIDKDFNFSTSKNVSFGLFCHDNYGKITNCSINSPYSITGQSVFGGSFCANNYGDIRKCFSESNVKATSTEGDCIIGAFTGSLHPNSIIEMSRSSFWPKAFSESANSSLTALGGFVGISMGGSIVNCYSRANVQTKSLSFDSFSASFIGIVSGEMSTIIDKCCSFNNSDMILSESKSGGGVSCSSGGVCLVKENARLVISNSLMATKAYSQSSSGKAFSGYFLTLKNDNSTVSANNCYYINKGFDLSPSRCELDIEFGYAASFDKLSLRTLNWDSQIWAIDSNGIIGFIV